MGCYQALVYGFEGQHYKPKGPITPLVSAPTRKEARKRLREHLSKDSLTPISIQRLWMITFKKKRRS
jgi:hypothetical protein